MAIPGGDTFIEKELAEAAPDEYGDIEGEASDETDPEREPETVTEER